MKTRIRAWMVASGLLGFTFFIVANFAPHLRNQGVVTGCAQIGINLFVCITWGNGYRQGKGLAKLVALIGIVTPIVMASITIIRIIIPALG